MEIIYRHHIIKLSRSIFCRLNRSHICVLIIDSLLYRQQNATKITEQCSVDGIKPSQRFDRLSHLITTLKHWEERERERGVEYALDSRTSKGVSVLNIFKAFHFENVILDFLFCRLEEMQGLSEIEVTTDFKRQTLRFKSLRLKLFIQGANRDVGTVNSESADTTVTSFH